MTKLRHLESLKKRLYHLKHEAYTHVAYRIPWLPPHRYVFVLTSRCNLKCKNCFQDRKPARGEMSRERWMALSEEVHSHARITITGGEPLLVPGFEDIFRKVASRSQCNLITNGTLLTEAHVDLFLSHPKFKVLAVSLDDSRVGSASLRGLSDKQWNRLEEVLRHFVRRRNETGSSCLLEIKTLVADDNASRLFELHRYCMEELQVDHHTFQFLKGSPLQHADKSFPLEQIFERRNAPTYADFELIRQELERIRDYNVQNGKVAFLHPIVGSLNDARCLPDISFLNSPSFEKERFKPCRFPWSSLHVNYDGQVFPCLSVPLGSVAERPLSEVLGGEAYRSFLGIIRRDGTVEACNRCGWLRPRASRTSM